MKLRSLDMEDVKWTTGFWAERFELCRKSMLPTLHSALLDPKCSAQLNRLTFTAGLYEKNPGGVNWADGDCYKWIEAMAHVHSVRTDPELDRLMDEWIAVIAKAQDEDGYISTNIGHDREKRLQMPYHHELYNMGHLLTAACIHHRTTGKTNFLEVAEKRGPLVYCLELPKQEGGEKTWHDGVFLPEAIELKPEHRRDFLAGVTVLKGNALTFKGRDKYIKDSAGTAVPKPAADADDLLYRPFTPRALREPGEGIVEISLIPYYAWANRGLSMMEVWIPLAR